ncbi:MAG: hypothetical protein ABIH86_06235 [Planctomycetota bacterium]
MNIPLVCIILLAWCAWIKPLVAYESITDELLNEPTRAPDWGKQREEIESALPPSARTINGMPGPDAPEIVHIAFWKAVKDFGHLVKSKLFLPTPEISQRLLTICKKNPELTPDLVNFLPKTLESLNDIRILYDKFGKQDDSKENTWPSVWYFLLYSKALSIPELANESKPYISNGKYRINREALEQLCEKDWTVAQPIVEYAITLSETELSVWATGLKYNHAVATADDETTLIFRKILIDVSLDSSKDGFARMTACKYLMKTEWTERDKWFEALISDATTTSIFVEDNWYNYKTSFEETIYNDPDVWIPILSRLINHTNPIVHKNAVLLLILFIIDNPREDVMKMLLPWKTNRDWVPNVSDCTYYNCYLKNVYPVEQRREPIGIILKKHNPNNADKERILLLKNKYNDINDNSRRYIIKSILDLGGYSVEELEAALIDTARILSNSDSKELLYSNHYLINENEIVPFHILLNMLCVWNNQDGLVFPEELPESILSHLDNLYLKEPETAKNLLWLIADWPCKSIDITILEWIKEGRSNASMVHKVLNRRTDIREKYTNELKIIINDGGESAGIASTILEDITKITNILNGKDIEAIRSLLACARKKRIKLPISDIGNILQNNSALIPEAKLYLIANDSSEARKMLYRFSDEYLILGAYEQFPVDNEEYFYGGFTEDEKYLISEIENKKYDEIFALYSFVFFGGNEPPKIIRINNGKAYNDNNRELSDKELFDFKSFISTNKIDDLYPIANTGVCDGIKYVYLHLLPEGGRRIYMNNPEVYIETIGTLQYATVYYFSILQNNYE